MSEIVSWEMRGCEGLETVDIERVGNLVYANLTVPVWQFAAPAEGQYTGKFVRFEDLPEDLREAFKQWQTGAATPVYGGCYHYDFDDFMQMGGKGWSGDFSAIVGPYLRPPIGVTP